MSHENFKKLNNNPISRAEMPKNFADKRGEFSAPMPVKSGIDINKWTKAIEENSGDIEAYYNRGLDYLGLKEYEKALSDFNKLIELESSNAYNYSARALAYEMIKLYTNALEDMNRAIELDSKKEYFYTYRAELNTTLGKYENAVEDYTKAIELNPEEPEYYNLRGNVYYNFLDQNEFALRDYVKAIALNKHSGLYYGNRGNTYFYRLNRKEEALKDYAKAIELNYAEAYGMRCDLYVHFNQYNLALEDIRKYIQYFPDDIWGYKQGVHIYIQLQQYKQAMQYAKKALKLSETKEDIDIAHSIIKQLKEITWESSLLYKIKMNIERCSIYPTILEIVFALIFSTLTIGVYEYIYSKLTVQSIMLNHVFWILFVSLFLLLKTAEVQLTKDINIETKG